MNEYVIMDFKKILCLCGEFSLTVNDTIYFGIILVLLNNFVKNVQLNQNISSYYIKKDVVFKK